MTLMMFISLLRSQFATLEEPQDDLDHGFWLIFVNLRDQKLESLKLQP